MQKMHNFINNSIASNRTIDLNTIIDEFIFGAKQQLGKHIQQIILYGSYARGEEKENSDIDILLLVDLTNIEIKEIQNDIYDLAYELELSTSKEISPIIINIAEFQYWKDTSPFYRNIEQEGVIIA